jgi:hypothetical protein
MIFFEATSDPDNTLLVYPSNDTMFEDTSNPTPCRQTKKNVNLNDFDDRDRDKFVDKIKNKIEQNRRNVE